MKSTIQTHEDAAVRNIATLMGINPNDVSDELRDVLLDHFNCAHQECVGDGSILSGYIEVLRLGVNSITQVDSIEVIAISPLLQRMIKDLRRSLKRLLPKEG